MNAPSFTRADLKVLYDWIPDNSRVLDLGCGGGQLLTALKTHKNVTGYGIECESDKVALCIERGVSVLQMDLNEGLADFQSSAFDYVILSLTLQALESPKPLLKEMLRVGQHGIVTFPNFAYWPHRLQLLTRGKMPVSTELPFAWYDTPNIHLCTIQDFRNLCDEMGFNIEASTALSAKRGHTLLTRSLPNVFGEISLHRFSLHP